MPELALSKMTLCQTCRHTLSFHPDAGACRARGCTSAGARVRCLQFIAVPDAKPTPVLPDAQAIGDALDVVVTVIEYALGAPRTVEGAVALKALLAAVPSLHKAAAAHPGRLPERIADACREVDTKREDAEVATDDAPRKPRT